MKKIVILLLGIISLCSCKHYINDSGIVVEVKLNPNNSGHLYTITVDLKDRIYPGRVIGVHTNEKYSVGDTIKFVKIR